MGGARLQGLLAGAMTVAIVAGCAASLTPAPAPATLLPAATPSPSPSPGRVMFSGTLDCGFPGDLERTTEGPVTTYTGTIECTYVASDPRASGTETGVITMAELDLPGYHVNRWFSRGDSGSGITNAGGSWHSTEAFGADQWDPDGGVHTVHTAAYVGEGGYQGLRMRLLAAQGTNEPGVPAYVVVGYIEPAK